MSCLFGGFAAAAPPAPASLAEAMTRAPLKGLRTLNTLGADLLATLMRMRKRIHIKRLCTGRDNRVTQSFVLSFAAVAAQRHVGRHTLPVLNDAHRCAYALAGFGQCLRRKFFPLKLLPPNFPRH